MSQFQEEIIQTIQTSKTILFNKNNLLLFLLGTIDRNSKLYILRGNKDILTLIFKLACEEWWSLHIHKYNLIPVHYDPRTEWGNSDSDDVLSFEDVEKYRYNNIPYLEDFNAFERKRFAGCPLAIVQRHIEFPPVATVFNELNEQEPLLINMMPFDLFDPEGTLPCYLHQYIHMIESCRKYNKAFIDYKHSKYNNSVTINTRTIPLDFNNISNRIAYLTIDERPIKPGQCQRRSGLHVEGPGVIRTTEVADKSNYSPDLSWYHRWGLGRAVDEYLFGGIFIASNVADTTAVWNARIHDTYGDIVGPYGGIERLRDVLGPADHILPSQELIWMSDRTPHESLPLPTNSKTTTRQFFRLVVGEISLWFNDHNTPNPTGFSIPPGVEIIHGNKFQNKFSPQKSLWEYGNHDEIAVATDEAELRDALYKVGLGFIIDEVFKQGFSNLKTLLDKLECFDERKLDSHIYSKYTKDFIRSTLLKLKDNSG